MKTLKSYIIYPLIVIVIGLYVEYHFFQPRPIAPSSNRWVVPSFDIQQILSKIGSSDVDFEERERLGKSALEEYFAKDCTVKVRCSDSIWTLSIESYLYELSSYVTLGALEVSNIYTDNSGKIDYLEIKEQHPTIYRNGSL